MATAAEPSARELQAERRRAALAAGGTRAVGTDAQGQTEQQPPSASTRATVAAAIVSALVAYLADRRQQQQAWLGQQLAKRAGVSVFVSVGSGRADGAPVGAAEIVSRVLGEEARREDEFVRRQAERFLRDVTARLALPDQRAREDAMRGLLSREEFYLRQRSEAMAARAFAAVDRIVLRTESPQGAFWKLSETVQEHTIGCLVMGGKFWPWAVLDRVHPPRHGGCPCRLVSYGEAIADGLMGPGDVRDVRSAIVAAAHVVMEGAVASGDDFGGLRDLLFEARTIELGDQLVESGVATAAAVEAAREGLSLGLEVKCEPPAELRERLGRLGLGSDGAGFFAYSPMLRTPSFPTLGEFELSTIDEIAVGE